jgi:hypothetical protein
MQAWLYIEPDMAGKKERGLKKTPAIELNKEMIGKKNTPPQ